MIGLGAAWQGWARRGTDWLAWHGAARLGRAWMGRQGVAWRGEAGFGRARWGWLGLAWRGVARLGLAGLARKGPARPARQGLAGMVGQGSAWPGRAWQAGQGSARPGMEGNGRHGGIMTRDTYAENYADRHWRDPAHMAEFLAKKAREMWPAAGKPMNDDDLHADLGPGIVWALTELFWNEYNDWLRERGEMEYYTTEAERER